MRQGKNVTYIAAMICMALLASPAFAQAKDPSKIKYPKLPDFKVPQPEIYTLDNGMTVFLLENHELPLINVSARIRTGSNFEPAQKTGMGDIFGQVQREGGTSSMTGDEIDDFLESRAASIETGMGGDSARAGMNCLEEDFDEVFGLFNDVLRDPVFAEDKIELAKVQLNSVIARRNDNVGSIVGREFTRLIYGKDSPLTAMNEYATIAAVERKDLLDWHTRYYHPNNVYLGVVGDFDTAEMKSKIEAKFGNWPRGETFEPAAVPFDTPAPGTYFIEKEDVTQANIRMGHLGIERKNPDYFAVVVMNEVLGGGFSGRLLQNVRTKKGLAYSVFGGIGSSYVRPGIFQTGMSTKSETMAESIDALKIEVAGIISDPPTEEEMKQAKESILNSFVFNYTSRSQILGQQMTFAYYDMPADYLETYQANIEKVTAENVARVAKKYIHPDKTVLLVVGNAADFDRPVSSFGEVTKIDIAIPPPPDVRPTVERTAANLEAGAALLDAMAETLLNGVSERVETLTAKYDLVIEMQGQSMSLGQTVDYVLPNMMRQTVRTPMGDQIVVFNAGRGFISAGGQKQPLPSDRVNEGLRALGRDLLVLSSHRGSPEMEGVAAGTDDVGGSPCRVVAVSYLDAESRLFIDEQGKVLKQTYQGKHPFQGTPGLMEVVFSDYGEIGGRLVPRKQVVSFDGKELANMTLDTMEINPELDLAQFEVPE